MNLVVDKEAITKKGMLYVLRISMEGKELVKVGVTCRDKVEDRICEILVSVWKRYRVFPELYVKRYRVVDNVYGKEARLHKELDEYRYKTLHKFSGSTEMFDVSMDVVVEAYERLLDEAIST